VADLSLRPQSALVLNYYQPWTYAGSERFTQLAREELRLGRSQAFVYWTAAGLEDVIEHNVRDPEYARLALYQFAHGAAVPRSPYAHELTGSRPVSLEALADGLRPAYVRSHFPAEVFREALSSPAYRRIPFVYDVMDLWDDFAAAPWGDSACERWYVDRADALISVSQHLVDRFAGHPASYLVPNGVDREFLKRIRPSGPVRTRTGRKQVLYMGSMGGDWFDWPLVLRLVRALPDHDFTFLGSADLPPEEYDPEHQALVRRHLAEMRGLANVRFCPEVPHDEIAPWLRAAHVGLIPFRSCDLVRAVSPLKVFEYLGAGSVVVQSGVPDIEGYPGVLTAEDPDGFIASVRDADPAALSAGDAARMAAFVEEATWAARLTDVDRIVEKVAEKGS
jgi:hypothetical protein